MTTNGAPEETRRTAVVYGAGMTRVDAARVAEPVRCPECGAPRRAPASVGAGIGFTRWSHRIAVALVVAPLIAVAVWLAFRWAPDPTGATIDVDWQMNRGHVTAATWSDVNEVASGGTPGPAVLALLDGVVAEDRSRSLSAGGPGTFLVSAVGPGIVRESTTITRGWPVPWWEQIRTTRRDADGTLRPFFSGSTRRSPDGLIHVRPDELWGMTADVSLWTWAAWRLVHRPAVESTGGVRVRTQLDARALAVPAVLACLTGMAIAGIRRVVRRGARDAASSGWRWAGRLAVLGVLAFGVVHRPADRRTTAADSTRMRFGMGAAATPRAVDIDLEGLRSSAERDRLRAAGELASAIRAAYDAGGRQAGASAPEPEPEPASRLAFMLVRDPPDIFESHVTGGDPPIISRVQGRWTTPPAVPPAGLRLRRDMDRVIIDTVSAGPRPGPRVRALSIDVRPIASLLLILLALAAIAGWLVRAIGRSRVRRRHRDGRCIECGHRLMARSAAVVRESTGR